MMPSDDADEEYDRRESPRHPAGAGELLIQPQLDLGSQSEPIPSHSGLVALDAEPDEEAHALVPAAPAAPAQGPPLASCLRRGVAKLFDWALTTAAFHAAVIYHIAGLPLDQRYAAVVMALMFGAAGSWFTWFAYNLLLGGRTLGKRLAGIQVVDEEGYPVRFGRVVGRTWAESLSWLFLCLGYLPAFFDPQKRTLHDHLAGTRVAKR